ncbi:anoctamin-7-like [Mauremys reevesii]|uniref:anoctamin-7-like n=1 Tax=Mauremys reevesii TaxID=260615 RepID=UPI00193F4FAC|nr:anoctamin-7-like [Mauremys reevesii]
MRRKSRHASPSFEDEEDEDDPIYVHGDEGYSPNLRGNYFRDGQTKIDFVLVWEEKVRPPKKRRGKLAAHEARGDRPRGHHEHWRRKFLNNLRNAGLLMEKTLAWSPWTQAHGSSAPLGAPCSAPSCFPAGGDAERAENHPLPEAERPVGRAGVLRRGAVPASAPAGPAQPGLEQLRRGPEETLHPQRPAPARPQQARGLLHLRLPQVQAGQVYEILARTIYGKRKRAEIGINRLLNERVYGAAFPLHEGPFETPESEVPDEALNPRQVLYRFWAQWGCWYRYQPMDHIRQYFGEKIAIYFAWLGFYTAWLLPAAAVGTVVFLAGLVAMGTNTPAI